ncbi:MAG: tetratricopeptide repeat protein [Anaeromyxobacteraceae bacterium]
MPTTGPVGPLTPSPIPPSADPLLPESEGPIGPLTPWPIPSRPTPPPPRTTGAFPPPLPEGRPTGSWPPPVLKRAEGRPVHPTDPFTPTAPDDATVPPAPPRAVPPRLERRPPELQPRTKTDAAFPPPPRPSTDPGLKAPAAPPPLPREERATGAWPPPLPSMRAGRPPGQLAAAGREALEAGELDEARRLLEDAFQREPTDLTVARDLQRLAEQQGRDEDYLSLGELLADALASYDPAAAAARYRHFAELARQRLGRDEKAAGYLEKAIALVPDDAAARRELLELWASRPDTAPRALAAWLEVVRADPGDGQALAAVVSLTSGLAATSTRLDAGRLQERGRIASALGAVVAPGRVPPARPAPVARALPPGLREKVALPGAGGPLARLIALLAPWLETLFPADLARRGASPADRIVPPRGAALRGALDAAVISLGARSYAAFLTERPGVDVAIENTQPPSIVATAGVEGLPDPALAFLAARSIDLLTQGWALIGKFAPRDVGILLELACRYAGGSPPSLGLPEQRAGAFLKALEASVPAATRASATALAGPAAAELAKADPRSFSTALRRTANRVALVHAGDPGAALLVLAQLERRGPGDPLPRPLEHADARDLAAFALTDLFLDLRVAVRG